MLCGVNPPAAENFGSPMRVTVEWSQMEKCHAYGLYLFKDNIEYHRALLDFNREAGSFLGSVLGRHPLSLDGDLSVPLRNAAHSVRTVRIHLCTHELTVLEVEEDTARSKGLAIESNFARHLTVGRAGKGVRDQQDRASGQNEDRSVGQHRLLRE